MSNFPIAYNEPLFRPPSEGNSLIIQVTLGCSWNKCAFCEMYTSKHFTVRNEQDVFNDIEAFIPYAAQITKVFLADGDPLVLSNKRLIPILKKVKATFSNLRRISTYASPTNINKKTSQQLDELRFEGLSLLYVGIESGDSQVLQAIQKGETYESTVSGLNKAKAANMDCSVMIINGVGGKKYSNQHAIRSAEVLNDTQPKFASTLVLTAYKGIPHFKARYKDEFEELTTQELFTELHLLLSKLELKETIFRSDHASNQLVLKGILGRDKSKLINQVQEAINNPNSNQLRQRNYSGY